MTDKFADRDSIMERARAEWHDALRQADEARKAELEEERRDRFAMAVLTGLFSQCDSNGTGAWNERPEDAYSLAYKAADAMMVSRK